MLQSSRAQYYRTALSRQMVVVEMQSSYLGAEAEKARANVAAMKIEMSTYPEWEGRM